MNRRSFIKKAGIGVGGLATAGTAGIALSGESGLVFDPNNSFWADALPPPNAPLGQNLYADVAIIGGGYTGLSAAYHLKLYNPNLTVALLEARQCGHGASGRHGGMLLPQPPTESFEISDTIALHTATYAITADNLTAIKACISASGIPCDLALDGYCHTITDEADLTYYKTYVQQVNRAGMPLTFWNATDTEEHLGTDYYAGAVFDPNGGSVHAGKFIAALKHMAERAGVEIYENTVVHSITEGKTPRLLAGQGRHTVYATRVVLATNGYTSKLGYFTSSVMPVHVQSAVTEPLTQTQVNAIGWESRLPFFDSRNFLFHFVLRPDNRIVLGGGSADYFFRGGLRYNANFSAVAALLQQELFSVFPALRGLRFDAVWNGVLGMTADETPVIGVTGGHNNIYAALAYNGQGVNMAFLYGDIIAHMLCGKPHAWQQTAYYNNQPAYIPPEPFRWIGANALMRYYLHEDNA